MRIKLALSKKNNPIKAFLNYFKNLRFRHKLFISYLAVIIIPIAVLGFYSYTQSRNYLLNETKQGLSESIKQISDNLNYKLKSYNTVIKYLVYNDQIVRIIYNEDSSYFERYVDFVEVFDPLFTTVLNINSDIDKMMIYTGNKSITERTNSIQSIDRISNKAWFKTVMSDKQIHWIIENHSLVGLCRFMEPYKGAPVNLLYADIKYDNLFDIDIQNINEFGIFITDSTGQMLYSKNNMKTPELKYLGEEISKVSEGETLVNGVKCLLIRSKILETGWTLNYLSPVSVLAIDANKIVGATAIIILCCLVILILLTWIFSNTLVKRIESLNKKMKIVEDGNLKIDVSSNSKDEIGELTNRFGTMLKNINVLIHDVYSSKIIQKEAELKALQAQINPHFLYNTLSLINWKAIQANEMEISHITNNISKFYRTILNKGKSTISIADEIANTKSYVEIQLVMHDYSFDVEYLIDDDILKYYMINIILQPIVENAIEHGIDQKRVGKGKLTISGSIKEDFISFDVEDNGPGFVMEKIDNDLLANSKGYGLKNVQERIKITFGEEYGVSVTSKEGKGTKVNVKIPKKL